jgi:hypothetical protein
LLASEALQRVAIEELDKLDDHHVPWVSPCFIGEEGGPARPGGVVRHLSDRLPDPLRHAGTEYLEARLGSCVTCAMGFKYPAYAAGISNEWMGNLTCSGVVEQKMGCTYLHCGSLLPGPLY